MDIRPPSQWFDPRWSVKTWCCSAFPIPPVFDDLSDAGHRKLIWASGQVNLFILFFPIFVLFFFLTTELRVSQSPSMSNWKKATRNKGDGGRISLLTMLPCSSSSGVPGLLWGASGVGDLRLANISVETATVMAECWARGPGKTFQCFHVASRRGGEKNPPSLTGKASISATVPFSSDRLRSRRNVGYVTGPGWFSWPSPLSPMDIVSNGTYSRWGRPTEVLIDHVTSVVLPVANANYVVALDWSGIS